MKSLILKRYFLFASLEAILAIGLLFTIPADTKNAWFLGYSRSRWMMAGGFLGLSILFASFIPLIRNNPNGLKRIGKSISMRMGSKLGFQSLLVINIFFLISSIRLIFSTFYLTDPYFGTLLNRLIPLIVLVAVLSAQTLVVLPLLFSNSLKQIYIDKKPIQISIIFLLLLLGIWGTISYTGIGVSPPRNSWGLGWGNLGVPLLTNQALLALSIGAGVLVLSKILFYYSKRTEGKLITPYRILTFDILFGLMLWLLAIFLWWREPLSSNWFAPPPRPPTFMHYPYSDAVSHDIIAQNILVGEGLTSGGGSIVRRPFYALFLAILHSIAGSDYNDVARLQIVALAIFPVLIYILGTALHHRVTGAIAAGLVIFRETNAIALSNRIDVSHSKLFMSDLPTALAITLFTILIVAWLKKPHRWRYLPFIAGGVLGLTMLIRTQVIMLITVPLVFIVASILRNKKKKLYLNSAFFLGLGVLLAILPLLWRNWRLTKGIVLDPPVQVSLIAKRYSPSPDEFNAIPLPGETEGEFTSRMSSQALQFFLQRPTEIVYTIASNFFHSQVSSIMILPTSFLGEDSTSFIYRVRYWFKWEGPLLPETIFPLLANLILVAFGLGGSWNKQKLIGLVPLLIFLVYILSNAIVTISGWRFILPVDWAIIIYFSVGLTQTLYLFTVSFFPNKGIIPFETHETSPNTVFQENRSKQLFQIKYSLLIALVILLFGSTLPLADWVFPLRFQTLSKTEILDNLREESIIQQLPSSMRKNVELKFEDRLTTAFWGRALYPRYFEAGDGDAGAEWPSIRPRTCNQLGFILVGPENVSVYLPHTELVDDFPNASDVVIIGYPDEKIVEASAVILLDNPEKSLVSSNIIPSKCPIFR